MLIIYVGPSSSPNTDTSPFFSTKPNTVFDITNMSEECLETSRFFN